MKKRVALAWLSGGALFMATVAAPLTGAAASYFWTVNVVDARGDDVIVAMRLRAAVAHPGIWVGLSDSISRFENLSDCAKSAPKMKLSNELQPATPLAGISWDINEALVTRDDEARDRVALAAYLKLPRPILGALDGCIAGSLLATQCTRYARRAVDDYFSSHSHELRAADQSSIRRADDELCTLAGLTKTPTAPPKVDRRPK